MGPSRAAKRCKFGQNMTQPFEKLKIIYRAHKGPLPVPEPRRLNALHNATFCYLKI